MSGVAERYDPQFGLTPVGSCFDRADIYGALIERIPKLSRMQATTRTFTELGIDALLDSLLEIQYEEAFELLTTPEEVGYGQ